MARRCGVPGRILETVPPSPEPGPGDDPNDVPAHDAARRRSVGPISRDRRRGALELLLQATDDLSLVVTAEEVWRAGDQLQRASRSLSAPHEVFLAELGRAVRIYPELGEALRQPTPTGLALDLNGAHRFLAGAAPALEVAGFGVLLPSWWGRPSARLGVRLKTSSPSTSPRGPAPGGLLNQDGICAFDWEAALGDQQIDQAELLRLAKLKAPLVNVRGQWMEFRPAEVDRLVSFLAAQPRTKADRTMTIGEVLQVAAGVGPDRPGVPILGISAEGQLGALLRGELEGTLDVRSTPDGFVGELRPYQQRGVAWLQMLERLGLGACLADDMGLGKTATVLALLQNEHLTATGHRRRKRAPGGAWPHPGHLPDVGGRQLGPGVRALHPGALGDDAPWRHPVQGGDLREVGRCARTS